MTDQVFKVPPRVLVTGLDEEGDSVFISDSVPTTVAHTMDEPTFRRTDLWRTYASPPHNGPGTEEFVFNLSDQISPTDGGTVFRIVQFGPDYTIEAKAKPMAESVGTKDGKPPRHFRMHTTASVDYAMVLSGEIWAIMDKGEEKMLPGDVLIQRGTNHAWSNRTDEPCIMLFVLMSTKPAA